MNSVISKFPLIKYVSSMIRDGLLNILKVGPVPKHIALIMDGNRRYAKMKKMETSEGHNAGFDTLSNVLEMCYKVGVECVTIFAFSIENFKRPKREVNALMEIAKSRLAQICENGALAEQYGIRIHIIGNLALVPPEVRQIAEKAMEITKNNDKVVLNICFPYTSSDDITQAIKSIVNQASKKEIHVQDIQQSTIDENLYTNDSPPIDILIRTSGIQRLSNFMLWECNDSSTIVFLKPLWPQLSFHHLYMILLRWSFEQSTALHDKSSNEIYENENDISQYSDSSTLEDSDEDIKTK